MATESAAAAGLESDNLKMVSDLEVEMMSDMYNKMTASCHKKCIPPKYKESDLSKGESVCIDRCVAKYLEIHDRIGKQLTQMSVKDEEFIKKLQEQSKK
ncbi:protein transporter tim10 [Chamberlinius hualienensis]